MRLSQEIVHSLFVKPFVLLNLVRNAFELRFKRVALIRHLLEFIAVI